MLDISIFFGFSILYWHIVKQLFSCWQLLQLQSLIFEFLCECFLKLWTWIVLFPFPPAVMTRAPPVVMSTPYLSIFSPNTGKCGKNVDQNNSEYGYFLRSENLANSELPRGNPPSKLFWLTNSWVDKYSVPSSPQNFNLKNWCDPDKTLPTRVYCEIQKLTRDSQWLDIFPGWTKLFHIVWEV